MSGAGGRPAGRHPSPAGVEHDAREPCRRLQESLMTVGATTQRTPAARTSSASSASASSMTRVPTQSREIAGHAGGGRLVAELDEEPVGRSLQRRAGHDRRHGHDRVRGEPRAPPRPRARRGSGRSTRPGSTGRPRRSRRRRARPARPAPARPRPRPRSAPPPRRPSGAASRSTPGRPPPRRLASRSRVRTGSSLIGRSRTREPEGARRSRR